MDNIKNLISLTHKKSTDNEKYLSEAFRLLNSLISKRNINECFEQATEMCVILGENCLKNGIKSIASQCVKLYFSLDPQENQYLARAYLMQAQLIHPQRFDDETALDKPIGFIMKAVNFSKKEKRFYYLIYNSSLVYYEVVRNYLRPNYYQFLCKSLSQICKVLEEVNDPNMQWRSQLMLLLIQCHIDAGHRKEVIQIVDSTATFIGKHSPYLLKDLLTTLINNGIGTLEKYLWYTKNHPAMQMFIRLCKLKIMKDKDNDGSTINEARKILSNLIGNEESAISGSTETLNGKPDQKTTPVIPISSKRLTNEQRCSLLLELSKISLQKSIFDVCRQCILKIQQLSTEEMLPILQETDFINFELIMMESDLSNEKITSSTLNLRLKTIEKCKTTLLNVIRSENNRLIELGCASLWNICLPILQPNLIVKIHSNLVLISDSLESIKCLNYKLCAQVNIEVGKSYAILEQTNDAIKYFKQAILLDRSGEYTDLIEFYMYKLKMQEKLYEKPSDPCDEARQLLEQVRSILANEKIPHEKLRPLLAQIGHCLAPDDFLVLLDHDLSIEESGTENNIHGKYLKTSGWENVITRINSYLLRSGNVDDRKKMSLWVDLVKLSRKVQLWDICRVASSFAVLYDDGRWKNYFQIKPESSSRKGNRISGLNPNPQNTENNTPNPDNLTVETDFTDSLNSDSKSKKKEESELSISSLKQSRFEKVLLEQIVEVYFIKAEAFIQALRNEGAQLFTFPERPKDFKKHPKGFVKDTTKEDSEWKNYCESLEKLSNQIVTCFTRAAAISLELQAPWLTQNAATYLWNYSIHVISLSDHGILVPSFQLMYDYLRQMINEKTIEIITQYGIVLAHGLIQKTMPSPIFSIDNIFDIQSASLVLDKKTKKDRESPKIKATGQTGTVQSDAVNQYKKALDICQYLMEITSDLPTPITETPNSNSNPNVNSNSNSNSNNNKVLLITKTVDLKIKSRLIEIWVQCKQLLQQSIGRTLGTDDVEIKIGQRCNVRAITAVQMVWICQNEFYKFPDLPTVDDCLQYIDICEWQHSIVLLNLLVKLSQITMKGSLSNQVNTLMKITEKAVKICPNLNISVVNQLNKNNSNIEEKLAVSYIYFCHGICLHKTSQNTSNLIQCLQLLVKACCYARDGNNYFFVSQISHYFWKIAQSLIKRFSSTCQIANEIEIMVNCISLTVDKKRLKLFFESHPEEEKLRIDAELEEKLPYILQISDDQKLVTIDQNKALFLTCYRRKMSKVSLEQDLQMRIQMHIAIFQSYFFKEQWAEALKVLDDAINDLPRTNHRLDLFRHRLLTKVRLGQSIELDIQKFKNQKEEEIALLWREVSIRSNLQSFQLFAYKKSIESLKMKNNDWLKVDLVMEMCQWLFHSNYPVDICSQYVDYAIDILLNIEIIKEKISAPSSAIKNKSRIGSQKSGSAIKSKVKVDKVPEISNNANTEISNSNISDIEQTITTNCIGISLQPFHPNNLEDITDIRLLSKLITCLTIQAKFVGKSSSRYRDNIITAISCIIRIWQISMSYVGAAVKELAKSKVEAESPTKSKDKKDKKDKNIKSDQEPVKSKVPKRKGPIDWLPSTYEEWATFEVSDDILEAINSPVYMPTTGIHEGSIPNIGQFMGICDNLIDMLEEVGYEFLSFPLLSLMDAVSRFEEIATTKLFNQYIHLRWFQLSIRLNMQEAMSHHEKFIDLPFVTPEYSAYVQIVIANVEEFRNKNKSDILPINFQAQSLVPFELAHLYRKQTKYGYIHETWIKISWKLIELGYNKEASETIYAAEELSKVLQDMEMINECRILKARLLKNQGEIDEALLYIDEINGFQFTMKQWYEIIELLMEIGMDETSEYSDICKIRLRMLRMKDHTVRRIAEIKLSNQKPFTDNLIARMNYCLVMFDKRIAILDVRDEPCWQNTSEILEMLFNRLDEIESLYENNKSFKCLIEILQEKLNLIDSLLEIADETKSESLLMKKLSLIEKCLSIQLFQFDNIHQVCSQTENMAFNLPIDRKLARTKLLLVDCLLSIYSRKVDKVVHLTLEHRLKDPLTQIVDEYVADVIPETDSVEWRIATTGICDRICSHLSDMHALCSTIPDLNAQCLLKYGHVLKLRAMEIYPNNTNQWNQLTMDSTVKTETNNSKFATQTDVINVNDITNLENIGKNVGTTEEEITKEKYRTSMKMIKAKIEMNQNHEYLNQAIEMLNQSISISINNQLYNICCSALEVLIDIVGQFDSQLAAQLLCVHQNCRASIRLRHVLLMTLRKASIGQLAALVLQHNYLVCQTKSKECNLTESPLYRSVIEKLNSTFLAWKITNLSLNPTEMLKDLSNLSNGFFLLEHSLDHKFLYCAFLDSKQKSSNISKTTTKPVGNISDRTKICRIKSSTNKINQMKNSWRHFKTELDNLMFVIENKNQIFQQRENLYSEIENENEIQKTLIDKLNLQENRKMEIEKMEKKYLKAMENLKEFLSPIFERFGNFLSTETDGSGTNTQKITKENVQHGKDSIILLIDEILAETTLEFVPQLKSAITRDFSLHIFHQRFKGQNNQESTETAAQTTDNNKKKDKLKTPHRLPVFRELSKKSTKVISLNRQIPPGTIPLDTHQIRYIVDPFSDTTNTSNISLCSFFKKELSISTIREQQITPRWLGIIGEDEYPSICEIELYLKDANSMIYVNTENIISLLTPQKILMLNTSDLQLICCFDRMKTRKTKERIIKKSSEMNSLDVDNQNSVTTAQMISLMGARSIVCNQWANLVNWTELEISKFLSSFLDDGLNLNECIHQIRNPSIEQESDVNENGSETLENLIKCNLVLYGLPNLMISGSA